MGLDIQRLGRILEMLASSHDGEVVAAARAATRLVKEAGLTWTEVAHKLDGGRPAPSYQPAPEARGEPRSYTRARRPERAPPKKRAATHKGVRAADLVAFLLHPSSQAKMTTFEKAVVETLRSMPNINPSEAQWRIIWETGQKVGAIAEPFAA